jgi:hypothetical protein
MPTGLSQAEKQLLRSGGGLPRLGYSIKQFCDAIGISVSHFYELKKLGKAPRTLEGLGVRRIIAVEEAQRWCRERTTAA